MRPSCRLPRTPRDETCVIRSLAAAAVDMLRAWLDARQATPPYPSTVERKALAAAGGISVEQVTYWLSGQRRAARRAAVQVCCLCGAASAVRS